MKIRDIRNPRTGAFDERMVITDAATVAQLALEKRAAQASWSSAGVLYRAQVLREWASLLEANKAPLLDALSRDTGRRLISVLEIDGVVRALRRWCDAAPALIQSSSGRASTQPSVRFEIDLLPYPLVGCISPWNFPLTLALIDAIPALLAGSAVLIKPSEVAPRFAAPLRESLSGLPALAQVLGIIDGDGETGAALLNQVDALCFTGSVATGRRVAVRCAERMIPAFLELGGKDPVIVMKSADIERAASTVLRASVSATGQACQSLERIYVDAQIADGFVARLLALAQACELNFPDIGRGQIGPLIFANQAEIIKGQLEDAKQRGAKVLCGGDIEQLGGGLWLRPTVLTGVNHEMRLMNEENFGPVMPVMAFSDIDEAVALANHGEFGLSAAVLAGTLDEALLVARRLEVGAVSINDGALTSLIHDAEKNAFKFSGIGGSRMGAAGLTRFFRKRALLIQEGSPASMALFEEAQLKR